MAKTLWFFADGEWHKVATSDELPVMPDVSGAIFYDFDNVGDWLDIVTTDSNPSTPFYGIRLRAEGGESFAGGIFLHNVGQGGMKFLQDNASNQGILIESFGGGIEINSTGGSGGGGGTGGQIRITNNSDTGGIFIEDSGSGGDIQIHQDGGGAIDIRNTGGPYGITINVDSDAPLEIQNFGGTAASYIHLHNTGDGGITIEDVGNGGITIICDGDFNMTSGGNNVLKAAYNFTDNVYEWTLSDGVGNDLLKINHSSGAWHYHIKTGASWVADL